MHSSSAFALHPQPAAVRAAVAAAASVAEPQGRRLTPLAAAEFLLPYVAAAHARGELPLQTAIAQCRSVLEAVPFALAHERQERLRQAVAGLLRAAPAHAVLACSSWPVEACHDLVDLVSREEGLAIARIVKHGDTAFERAASVLRGCGIPATASSVEKARTAWKRRLRAA